MVDKAKQYRKLDPFLGTSDSLAYMLFALLNGLVLKWPIPGAKDSPLLISLSMSINTAGPLLANGW